jgi:hypothetical protein
VSRRAFPCTANSSSPQPRRRVGATESRVAGAACRERSRHVTSGCPTGSRCADAADPRPGAGRFISPSIRTLVSAPTEPSNAASKSRRELRFWRHLHVTKRISSCRKCAELRPGARRLRSAPVSVCAVQRRVEQRGSSASAGLCSPPRARSSDTPRRAQRACEVTEIEALSSALSDREDLILALGLKASSALERPPFSGKKGVLRQAVRSEGEVESGRAIRGTDGRPTSDLRRPDRASVPFPPSARRSAPRRAS